MFVNITCCLHCSYVRTRYNYRITRIYRICCAVLIKLIPVSYIIILNLSIICCLLIKAMIYSLIMNKFDLSKIKLINKEGVELTGRYLQAKNSKSAIFYSPGFGGGFGKIGEELADFAQENGYGFLFGKFQDSYAQKLTTKHFNNGNKENVVIGGSNARLHNCLADFDAFFNFINQQGYEKIFCVAMCVSCSKIVYFLQNNDYYNKKVSNLILLAP